MSSQGITYLIDAQDRASGKIRKHRQEIKALAADAKRKESAAIQAGRSVIESTKTELERIREKIEAVRAYSRTSGKAANDSRSALSRLIEMHKNETAAIKEKAAAESKQGKARSASSAAAAVGQIGGAAGEAAGNVSFLLSEIDAVSAASGKAAVTMKVGMAGVAAVVGFKVGNALGNLIFQTEKWKRKSQEAFKEISDSANRLNGTLRTNQQRGIELAATLGKVGEQNKLKELFERAGEEAAGAATNVRRLKKRIDEMRGSDFDLGLSEVVNDAFIKAAESELDVARQALTAARDRRQELENMISPAAKALKAAQDKFAAENRSADALASIRQELELAKAKGEDRLRIEARIAGVLDSEIDSAVAMRKEVIAIAEAEKQRAEAKAEADRKEAKRLSDIEAARKKAIADRASEEQRVTDFQNKTLDGLKLQLIEYTKGKAAAEAFKLAQGGFESRQASILARFKAKIESLNKSKEAKAAPPQANTAKDERLATGRVAAAFKKTAAVAEAERQTRLQTRLVAATEALLAFERSRPQPQAIKVLGN